jgi:hypothetical protein
LLPISDLLCFALEALISTVIPALDYQIQGQASTENARRYAGKYDEHPPPGASITRSTKKHPGHPSTPQNPMKPFTYTLTAQQKAEICDQTQTHLAACPEIAFAYIHGSFTEDMAQIHDIDVGVYFNTTQNSRPGRHRRPPGTRTYPKNRYHLRPEGLKTMPPSPLPTTSCGAS